MDRLRDLAARSSRRVECRLRVPKSLSTTSLMLPKATELDEGSDDARSTVSSTSASAVLSPTTCLTGSLSPATPSLHSDPTLTPFLPPPAGTRNTPAQPRAHRGISTTAMQTSSTNKRTKHPEMERDTVGQAALKGYDPLHPSLSVAGREADQRLFDQVLTSIAQNDVIANSGHDLHRRVNDCARDYMEAKQIVERREHEIAAISTKIESMQATIDNASKHLRKAQDIAAEAIDSSVSEQFMLREQDNLTNILIGMTNAIAKGDCHTWPADKVNKCLEDLQSVYHKNKYYCQSPIVSSGIVHVAKHFVFHANYDDAFEPMLFHLANQTDYKGFVERSGRQDHEFARQHHSDYSSRPGAAPKTNTGTTKINDAGPTGKVQDNYCDDGGDAAAIHGGSDGATGVAHADSDGSKLKQLQKLTPLPPRSSSLPSSARKMPGNNSGRPGPQQTPSNIVLSEPCENSACIYRHFDFKTNADFNTLADEICSKMEPQPGVTSRAMSTAVLESIAGLEAIFKDGMVEDSSDVKRDVSSAVKFMERLNKDHVNSDQVAKKLSAVAETHGLSCSQPHEVSGGHIRVGVKTAGSSQRCACKTAGSSQRCACKTARQGGPESKAANDDKAIRKEGDMTSGGEDSDLLWKAYVSSTAPTKR